MAGSTEKSIFLEALDQFTPSERERFLQRECAGDTSLRQSIDRLLAAHERADNPLDKPVAVLSSDPNMPLEQSESGEGDSGAIGPYRLMEQIGEGGFGIVYVAEQQQPVRRRVALKVIKPGMDTREVIARFEAERQALAVMDHPNIARVFDGGATPTGRPYFVMELVRGVPITEFCDQRKLTTPERLELFITVCRAVQHAHQKGVIHRDLKPSNILITLHDGSPVAKVIDFGVAKAIGPSMTDKTIYTRFTAMIGTPLYMSPEQAEMTSQDVDTRSDIYSLGVILYELLTGSTPFDGKRLSGAGVDEVRRIIREERPPLPSARLSRLGAKLTTVSISRRSAPDKLQAQMRGDLDWIAMKTIDKDRSRRYETANDLASDLLRYLRGEPIEARPPTRGYLLRKFAMRNKAAITTSLLLVSVLLLGMVVSAWQAIRATHERNEKEIALHDAITARQEANAALQKLEQFNSNIIQVNALLASGDANADAQQWSAAAADFTHAVHLQPNYYLAWIGRGSFYVHLGLWSEAADDFKQAFRLGVEPTGSAWSGVPALYAMLGEWDSYYQLRRQLLATTSAGGALTVSEARGCLMDDLDPSDAIRLAELMQSASQRGGRPPREPSPGGPPESPPDFLRRRPPDFFLFDEDRPPPRPPNRLDEPPRRSPGPGPGPNRGFNQPRGATLYATGLAWMRAGQHQKAIDCLDRANSSNRGWPGRGLPDPVLAISHLRAGDSDMAATALERTDQNYEAWVNQMARNPAGHTPIPWFDWVEFITLRREAHWLINGEPPSDDERLESLQTRAWSLVTANALDADR